MNLKSIVEALLFVHGEPVKLKKLAKITKAKEEEVKTAIQELSKEYAERGFAILEKDDMYQLGSNPACTHEIEELMRDEFSEELSRAAIETLAIIAYRGPKTRAEIEYVRGVNSSFTLRNLLMRGLIERIENPKDARSYLYRISFTFLKHMGISRPEELPEFDQLAKEKIEILDGAETPNNPNA